MCLNDKELWQEAIRKNTLDGFKDYLEQCPEGIYCKNARQILLSMQNTSEPVKKVIEQVATHEEINNVEAPDNLDVDVKDNLPEHRDFPLLSEDEIQYRNLVSIDSIVDLRKFLVDFPDSLHVLEIKGKLNAIEEQEYRNAKLSNSISSYKNYIQLFPSGKYVSEAERSILNIENRTGKKYSKLVYISVGIALALIAIIGIIEIVKRPRTEEDVVEIEPEIEVPKIDTESHKVVAPNCELIFAKGGEFQMGNTSDEITTDNIKHTVLVDSFMVAINEVNIKDFYLFLNDYGSLTIKDGENKGQKITTNTRIPKENGLFFVKQGAENESVGLVTWYGANEYAKWLSEKTRQSWSLPTEAQWEWAALNLSLSNIGDGLTEWCLDFYHKDYYKDSPQKNPVNIEGNNTSPRVIRDYYINTSNKKLFYRSFSDTGTAYATYGFRLVRKVF